MSAGAPRHGQNFASQLQDASDEKGWGYEIRFVAWQEVMEGKLGWDAKVVWNIGNFGNLFHWWEGQGRYDYDTLICHWIGTDILQHQEILLSGNFDPLLGRGRVHLADALHLVGEVHNLFGPENQDVKVHYVRSIPPHSYPRMEIGRWDSVVCYVPHTREDFFRYPWIREAAADYSDLTFQVLRPGISEERVEGNIHEYPELERPAYERLMADSFVFIRPCVHDGVSLTLIEFAQAGRHVLHSDIRIPFVLPARSPGEIEYRIDELLRNRTGPNPQASEYYAREYSRQRLLEDLERLRSEVPALRISRNTDE